MSLVRDMLLSGRILRLQQNTIRIQQQRINMLETDLAEKNLQYLREMEGFCAAFLLSLEEPEIDIRDELSSLLQAFSEHIAVTEEHVL